MYCQARIKPVFRLYALPNAILMILHGFRLTRLIRNDLRRSAAIDRSQVTMLIFESVYLLRLFGINGVCAVS